MIAWGDAISCKITGRTMSAPAELSLFGKAQEPVGGNAVVTAEGDDMADRDLVDSNFVAAVDLLGGIQKLSNISLAQAPLTAYLSEIISNIHNIAPLLEGKASLHLISCIDNTIFSVYN